MRQAVGVTDDAHRVGLLSTAEYAHLDEDLPLLGAALAECAVASSVLDWHDASTDWGSVDLIVVRSPWDYTSQVDAFLARLTEIDAATTLANPLDVVRWNADKRYLVELTHAGAPVVPTEVLDPGDSVRVPAGLACVVKPTVSAGARDTERYEPDQAEEAVAHAEALLATGTSRGSTRRVRPGSSSWATPSPTPFGRGRSSAAAASSKVCTARSRSSRGRLPPRSWRSPSRCSTRSHSSFQAGPEPTCSTHGWTSRPAPTDLC